MSYLGYIQRIITDRAPSWIATGYGGVFLQALGLTLDTAHATMLSAVKQTRPMVAFEDALVFLGADRGIRRYPTEPLASYRERLKRWRQIRRHAGSHYAQLLDLQPYFYPFVPVIRIVHQMGDGSCSTWHTMSAAGVYSTHRATPSNWNWDTFEYLWSRFDVIIYVNGIGSDAAAYDDGTVFDDGSTVYDGHMSTAQIADIVAMLTESKAAHAQLRSVIFATDAASFDPTSTPVVQADGATSLPDGNWSLATDPATGLPNRLASAILAYYVGPIIL